MKIRTVLSAICLAAFSSRGFSQTAPPAINYQGRLTQSTGVVVPDGLTGMRVRLFATASGGSALWDSGDLSVATKSGTFSILLASGSMPPMSPTVFALGTVYVEVEPAGQNPLLPRQPIASVPWAFYAQTVSDGAISSPKLASDPASLSKVSGGALTSNGTHIQLGAGPIIDQFMMTIKGNTSANTNIPGLYIENEGGQALMFLRGNTSANGGGAAIGFYNSGPGVVEKSVELAINEAGDLYTRTNTGNKVFFKYDGKVGIGTSDPQALLDVNGIIQAVDTFRVVGPAPTLDFKRDSAGYNVRLTNNLPEELSLIDPTGQPKAGLRAGRINLFGSNYLAFNGGSGFRPSFELDLSETRLLLNNSPLSLTKSPDSLFCAGQAYKPGGGSWSVLSDVRLKKNIGNIPDPLSQLLELRGRAFEYKNPTAIREREGRLYGFVAQEVERAFPSWVGTSTAGYKNVTIPSDFSALTVEAIRELKSENQALRAELAKERAARVRTDLRLNELAALVRDLRK